MLTPRARSPVGNVVIESNVPIKKAFIIMQSLSPSQLGHTSSYTYAFATGITRTCRYEHSKSTTTVSKEQSRSSYALPLLTFSGKSHQSCFPRHASISTGSPSSWNSFATRSHVIMDTSVHHPISFIIRLLAKTRFSTEALTLEAPIRAQCAGAPQVFDAPGLGVSYRSNEKKRKERVEKRTPLSQYIKRANKAYHERSPADERRQFFKAYARVARGLFLPLFTLSTPFLLLPRKCGELWASRQRRHVRLRKIYATPLLKRTVWETPRELY